MKKKKSLDDNKLFVSSNFYLKYIILWRHDYFGVCFTCIFSFIIVSLINDIWNTVVEIDVTIETVIYSTVRSYNLKVVKFLIIPYLLFCESEWRIVRSSSRWKSKECCSAMPSLGLWVLRDECYDRTEFFCGVLPYRTAHNKYLYIYCAIISTYVYLL